MFFGNILRKGMLRGFKHPNMPVAVDLADGRLGRVLVDFKKRTQKDPKGPKRTHGKRTQKDPKGPMTLIERLFLANWGLK